jgi:hypothetical protein
VVQVAGADGEDEHARRADQRKGQGGAAHSLRPRLMLVSSSAVEERPTKRSSPADLSRASATLVLVSVTFSLHAKPSYLSPN